MSYFKLNGEDLHLYSDADRGRDIVECSAAACAVRPCQNGAVCTQRDEGGGDGGTSGPSSSSEWFCNCPAGFTGDLCERPGMKFANVACFFYIKNSFLFVRVFFCAVCEQNPCRRGGTCLSSVAGPGFLCLCPLGSGGVLCNEGEGNFSNQEVEICCSVSPDDAFLKEKMIAS